MERFKDKVVIISGATSGIGKACAEAFSKQGATVALVGRSAARGKQLEEQIKEAGGRARFFRCDITNEDNVKELVEQIYINFGQINILFNNAGVMLHPMEIENISADNWKQTFDINVNGMFYLTRYAKPYLVRSRGCILNNASIAGLQHFSEGRSYAYSASKAAVIQFSNQMAKNYGKDGIRVNCICPGIIDTPILGTRDRKEYAKRVPLGYVGLPEEVANVVTFLASDEASYLTGIVLPIDGGASL